MVSVLIALAVLAAIPLLFALDPGGIISESVSPGLREMDWKQLAVWAFRTVGLVTAQLLIIVLWLWPKYRPPQATEVRRRPAFPVPPPGSMPAAAVSTLEGRTVRGPTLLAAIIEMCQRGTLRIEAVERQDGFLYRLTQQGWVQYEWERTICDSLPSRPVTVDALHEAISKREDAVGDQIGDYLHQRALFGDNPVRTRRDNSGDGADWAMLAGVLMGVGAGLWMALWITQWWASALVGALAGFVYLAMASPVPTGMLRPTQAGAHEIAQWLGFKESLAGPVPSGPRGRDDSMLSYGVALDAAHPWLDVSVPAPPWFYTGKESYLWGSDLDAAYHSFMNSQDWGLSGRSEDAANAARAAARPSSVDRDRYRADRPVQAQQGGGRLCGFLKWVVWLVAAGAMVLAVLFSLDVVSPRAKPCPLDSPVFPSPGLLSAAGSLLNGECVRVSGKVVYQDVDELLVDIDRGEYVQRVTVRVPAKSLKPIPPDHQLTLAGRLEVEEDGTYEVHFIPATGRDRGWWQNLRDNFQALFQGLMGQA